MFHEQFIKHLPDAKIVYTFVFHYDGPVAILQLIDFSEVKLSLLPNASEAERAFLTQLAREPARLQREAFYTTAEYLNGASGVLPRCIEHGQMTFASDFDIDDPSF